MGMAKKSRIIEGWAPLYDLVNFFVFFIFGGSKKLHSDIISLAGLQNGDEVLDIGCGTGGILVEIAKRYTGIKGYGIDASEKMVALAKRKAGGEEGTGLMFERTGADKLPYKDSVFDSVFNTFLLHHLPKELKLASLREAYRVLKPGGFFVLVDIDKPTTLLGRVIGMTRSNVKEVSENMETPLFELLQKSGFSAPELVRKDYGIFSFIRCQK